MPHGGVGGRTVVDPGLMETTRQLFLQTVKATYWDFKGSGELPGGYSATVLVQSIDIANDNTDEGLNDWDVIAPQLGAPCGLPMLAEAAKERAVFMANAYIQAHQTAQQR